MLCVNDSGSNTTDTCDEFFLIMISHEHINKCDLMSIFFKLKQIYLSYQ